MGALVPTMAARSVTGNPQLWYAASPSTRRTRSTTCGPVAAAVPRAEGRGPPASPTSSGRWTRNPPPMSTDESASDPESWAQANPGLGIRISEEYVRREQGALSARTFAVERLGVGDWSTLTPTRAATSPRRCGTPARTPNRCSKTRPPRVRRPSRPPDGRDRCRRCQRARQPAHRGHRAQGGDGLARRAPQGLAARSTTPARSCSRHVARRRR
jgi:hypothetical protein